VSTMTGRIVIGAVLAGLLGVSAYEYSEYESSRKQIDADIQRYTDGIDGCEKEMKARAEIVRELRAFGATTLGSDEEKVSATLRKSLNEMIAHFGLLESSVTSVKPTGVKNPAAAAKVKEFTRSDMKSVVAAPDFFAVSATLSAKGTLEQAMRVLATIQVQPWVHRVDGFTLKPAGKERDRVELTVTLTSLYMTDAAMRQNKEDTGWRPVREAEFASWMPIVVKNAFREPRAPIAVAKADPPQAALPPTAPPPPTSPPTPPPPYDEWRVTGLTTGRDGPQLMLVNEKTKEWRTIGAGTTILDAQFVGGAGETAELLIANERFTVRSGQRLSDRAKRP